MYWPPPMKAYVKPYVLGVIKKKKVRQRRRRTGDRNGLLNRVLEESRNVK